MYFKQQKNILHLQKAETKTRDRKKYLSQVWVFYGPLQVYSVVSLFPIFWHPRIYECGQVEGRQTGQTKNDDCMQKVSVICTAPVGLPFYLITILWFYDTLHFIPLPLCIWNKRKDVLCLQKAETRPKIEKIIFLKIEVIVGPLQIHNVISIPYSLFSFLWFAIIYDTSVDKWKAGKRDKQKWWLHTNCISHLPSSPRLPFSLHPIQCYTSTFFFFLFWTFMKAQYSTLAEGRRTRPQIENDNLS